MFVHGSRIQKQFEYLSGLGVDLSPIYSQTGIAGDEPFEQDSRFDFEQYKAVLDFALRQTGNPEYGLDFGNQPQLGGTVGMLSASSVNLKEAFVQGCKFLRLQGDFAELTYVDDPKTPKLVYTPLEAWAIESPQTAKLEVDAMFSFLNTILRVNSNHTLRPKQVNLTCAAPEHPGRYLEVFGVHPRFGAVANEMVFDRHALMIPMKAFNPETFRVLQGYLQTQLDQHTRTETYSDKVRRILYTAFQYRFPDIDSVADELSLSARTLQRKLSDEHTTFKELLQETRFGLARKLLKQQTFTVSEVSYILGYSDLANFSRSFKKYVGFTPQQFKEKNGK